MDELTIKVKLDMLADLRAAGDALALQKQALVDQVLTPEIRAQLAEIDAEFAGKAQEANEKATALEAEVKQLVIAHGTTVKGEFLMAKWVKGRAGSYDTTALDGYAAAHPEIKVFKKPDGEPTCSLVAVK
jgi:hypothetical protein